VRYDLIRMRKQGGVGKVVITRSRILHKKTNNNNRLKDCNRIARSRVKRAKGM
jgi:hypothetical protein